MHVSWEKHDLADIGRAYDLFDHALESDGEASMRWHAMFERLEISREMERLPFRTI